MIEEIFTFLSMALYENYWISLLASFGWGALSILLSPCHLSSIPLVVGYISSQGRITFGRTFAISLLFSLGMLITIAAIGVITAYLGRLMGDVGTAGNYLVAVIFFLVGLYLLDIIKIDWNAARFRKTRSKGMLAALILGLLFGIALGPCTFAYMAPVLGIVFQTAQTELLTAILLLVAFGMGHCSVIVLGGSLTRIIQKYLDWSEESQAVLWVRRICGVLVILGGIYLIYTVP